MEPRLETNVVIVDDSPAVRDSLIDLLASVGGVRVVGTADSPGAAIEAIVAARPQCVVLDFQLLGGTALDVLCAIRPRFPELKVIVLTNYPTSAYRRACMKAGADWFLDKTAEFEQVPKIIGGLGSTQPVVSVD